MPASTHSRHAGALLFARFYLLLSFIVLVSELRVQAQLPSVVFAGVQSTVPTVGLKAPAAVAVDGSGNLYIADTGNNRVVKVTTVGVQSTVLSGTILGSMLKAPGAVAVNTYGNLYVADTGNNRVLKVTIPGSATSVGTQLSSPSGLALDSSADVFIADTGNNRIVAVTPAGAQRTIIASTDTPGGTALSKPAGLSYFSGFTLMIADTGNNRVFYGIAAASTDFTYEHTVGSGLNKPTGVAGVEAWESIGAWIADTGNNRLLFALGALQAPPGSGLSAPGGLAADSFGNLYVADTGNNRIVKIARGVAEFGAVNIGNASTTQTFPFVFTGPTTLNAKSPVQVLTQGAANVDFQSVGAGTCVAKTYTALSACTVTVTFKPRVAGARTGAVVLEDTNENALATVYLHGTGQGPQIAYDPGIQSTLASGLSDPRGMAVDGLGNVYVADFGNGQIVKVTTAGVQSTAATIGDPIGLALDGPGNLYTTGAFSSSVTTRGIFQVTPTGAVDFAYTTYYDPEDPVGVAVYGSCNILAADGAGNLYESNAFDQCLQGMANPGSSYLPVNGGFTPRAVAVDGSGNIYVVDISDWLVWKYVPSTGDWSTVGAGYNRPQDVAVDQAGNVFVADLGNNQVVKVTPAGVQSTVGTDLSLPSAVAVDGAGNIYITDLGDGRLIKINRSTPPSLSFASTVVGKTSSDSPKDVTIENIGNAPLTFPVPSTGKNASLSAGFTLGSATTCPELSETSSAATLAAGSECTYQVSFTPTAAGSIKGSLVLTDNNLNVAKATQTIALSGTATAAAVKVDWAAPEPIAAGTALSAKQLDASASVPGKFTYSPAAGTKPAKGTVKLTATFSPNNTAEYKTTTATVDLVVE